jgi:hypothetical protein
LYLGFYAHRDPEAEPEHVRVQFPDEKETYDVRAGRYLGSVRELPLPLRAQEAALFARLDYRINKLDLSLPPSAARGQPLPLTIELDASKTPGRHIVHIEFHGPTGALMPLYTQNAVVESGRGQLQLMTALNDPTGTWRITAREVVSGLATERSIQLQ